MAKNSVARQLIIINEHFHEQSDSDEEQEGNKVVKSPSMMRMCCNMLEVIRLREELIKRVHET